MKLILGITGSVAAVLTPKLVKKLQESGHEVKIVATTPAMYFLDGNMILGSDKGIYFSPDHTIESGVEFFRDKDEWPLGGYHKNDTVRHIEFRTWADALLIAPLTANTLAKLMYGICDNFLTCIARAWPLTKPVILAPAMNTEMWTNPMTSQQLNSLCSRYRKCLFIDPVEKMLACGDVGKGAMADIETIAKTINDLHV